MSVRTLDQLIPRIQLAIFEILWSAQPRLRRVLIQEGNHALTIHFEWSSPSTSEERDSAEYLMQEVIDIAFADRIPSTRFVSDTTAPPEPCCELMSESIFKAIAAAHAPWRLASGR
jgi:hypothetical protein